MPLLDPPPLPVLRSLPLKRIAGLSLHRVYKSSRTLPWFFASIGAGARPQAHGRFDLPEPDGTCYTSTSAAGAVLETFQHLTGGLLPDVELRTRLRAEVVAPADSPLAANLTAARARGAGVHAALWADADRGKTQSWARQLRRAGHQAIFHGIQHDPTGRLRAVTLFDQAGPHAPYDDSAGWAATTHPLHTDGSLHQSMLRYGITITRSDPSLPVVGLEDSGLC